MAATATFSAAGDPEAQKSAYLSSISSMARKIMQERERIKERHGAAWLAMSPAERDTAIDDGMMAPTVRARYAAHRADREEVVCYPKLLVQTGQKVVHFGEEDLTWQDEHSAPFSWETKSQLEFSVILAAPETGVSASATESKPKPPQNGKPPGADASAAGRREEESSFWKFSAERSRLEGEKADFQSLTPSQIKSLEKGEKPLPSYLRSDAGARDAEEPQVSRSVKQRAPKPPAPPPPAPISVTPATMSVTSVPSGRSSASGGWERAQSTLPSVSSTLDEVFTPGLAAKSPSTSPKESETADGSSATATTFSQFNTSSSILKTGFDFLDNW
ncbi:uncharacterized protein C1orf198 homolog [Electrophorus electricus]|uniref:DUF4706 domain-containing protein n=1 Tax=Electrophorus electricus TaxID=8005 RepID=A0A4W4EAX5_ELEEL|nr:uncharacterized protein C1orf198 homolog [Electrophorus electricus]